MMSHWKGFAPYFMNQQQYWQTHNLPLIKLSLLSYTFLPLHNWLMSILQQPWNSTQIAISQITVNNYLNPTPNSQIKLKIENCYGKKYEAIKQHNSMWQHKKNEEEKNRKFSQPYMNFTQCRPNLQYSYIYPGDDALALVPLYGY